MDLQPFKCRTCGEPLDVLAAASENGLVTCPSCQNVWTLPKKEASPAALQFLHTGEHELDVGRFDDALLAYQKAAELDPNESEAYFGMALAEFKVRYLKVEPTNEEEKPRLQPICSAVTNKKFTECAAYLNALAHATGAQFDEYEKKANEIDYILGEFNKLQQAGKHYDCFICVKVTVPGSKPLRHTQDSENANYIYNLLQERGYKPFYSERELRNVAGADYEARILYALYTSECMLVVCNKQEYLQTPWVKNEYTRFLKLVNDEEKESDSITIVYEGSTVERLPGRPGKIQGINFSLRGADNRIVDFVDSHTPESKKRRAEERRKQQEKEEAILKQLDQLQKMQSGRGMQATASSLLTRGYQELAAGNDEAADKFFGRVLDAEPENGEAWWGKLLIELGVWNDDLLNERLEEPVFEEMNKSRYFENAVKYASGEFKDHLDEVLARLKGVATQRQKELEDEKAAISVDTKFVGAPKRFIKSNPVPGAAKSLGILAALVMIGLVVWFARTDRLTGGPIYATFLLRFMPKIPFQGFKRKLVGVVLVAGQGLLVGLVLGLLIRIVFSFPVNAKIKANREYNRKVDENSENAERVDVLERRIRIYDKFNRW